MTDRNVLETFESIMGHAHEAAADAVELAYDAGKQEERKRIALWLEERGITQTIAESDRGWWETSVGANYGKLTLALLLEGAFTQDEVVLGSSQ